MKKILCSILAIAMVSVVFGGCSGNNSTSKASSDNTVSATKETESNSSAATEPATETNANSAKKYILEINFDDATKKQVYDKKAQVTIVNVPAQADDGADISRVVCGAFKPLSKNVFYWNDDYSIYASQTELKESAVIESFANTEAKPDTAYDFSTTKLEGDKLEAKFSDGKADSTVASGKSGINNLVTEKDNITFGIAKTMYLNDDKMENIPINAFSLNSNALAQVSPSNKYEIYITSSFIDSGSVLNEISADKLYSNAFEIDMSSSNTSKTINVSYVDGAFVIK